MQHCIHAGRQKNNTHLYLYMLIKGVIIITAARWENADCGVMMTNWVEDLAHRRTYIEKTRREEMGEKKKC